MGVFTSFLIWSVFYHTSVVSNIDCDFIYVHEEICHRYDFDDGSLCHPWSLEHCEPIVTTYDDHHCPKYFCVRYLSIRIINGLDPFEVNSLKNNAFLYFYGLALSRKIVIKQGMKQNLQGLMDMFACSAVSPAGIFTFHSSLLA